MIGMLNAVFKKIILYGAEALIVNTRLQERFKTLRYEPFLKGFEKATNGINMLCNKRNNECLKGYYKEIEK